MVSYEGLFMVWHDLEGAEKTGYMNYGQIMELITKKMEGKKTSLSIFYTVDELNATLVIDYEAFRLTAKKQDNEKDTGLLPDK